MGDDWGDDDYGDVDWDAQEAAARARRSSGGQACPAGAPALGALGAPPPPRPAAPQQPALRSLFYNGACGAPAAFPPPGTEAPQPGAPNFHAPPAAAQPPPHNYQQQQPHGGAPPPAPPPPQFHLPPALPPQATAPAPPPVVTLYASLELPRVPARRTGSASAAAAAAAGVVRTAAPELELRMGWHDAAARALARPDLRCRFDPGRRAWALPLAQHDAVIEALAAAPGVRVRVEPLPSLAAAVLRAAAAIPDDSSRYAHVPAALEEQLMPFQREGVRFALSRGGRALIGDEMGLGKTVQALAVAACYRDEWPVLVVAPSSLREAWADAVHKWLALPEERVRVVHTGKDAAAAGAAPPGAHDFLIVSYNFLDKMELSDGRYRVVVVDESHYIKDGAAKRTKAAMPVLKEARRCLLLTGTPALNRPKEVFTQLAALLPAAKLRMPAFGERYCAGNRFDRYGGAANLEELHALLTGSVMVRRLKADVLAQLPQKRRQQVFLSLDAEGKRELAALQAQMGAVKAALAQLHAQAFASAGAAGGGAGRMEENRALMEAYRRTAELKRRAVADYVDTLLEGGQKILVFAHHACLLDAVERALNKRRAKYIRIDGKTPAAARGGLVASFQGDEQYRAAVLSIRAAGVGLTLTAASTVVFAEMTWTPGEVVQAEDRAHRIGQASAVNVHFLHVRGSADDIVWQSIQGKLENLGSAIDGVNGGGLDVVGARKAPAAGQRPIAAYLVPAGGGKAVAAAAAAVGGQENAAAGGGGAAAASPVAAPPAAAVGAKRRLDEEIVIDDDDDDFTLGSHR